MNRMFRKELSAPDASCSLPFKYQASVDLGKTLLEAAASALARLYTTSILTDCTLADLAVGATPEDIHLKRDLFRQLDAFLAPHALLASNNSSLSITALAARRNAQSESSACTSSTHPW